MPENKKLNVTKIVLYCFLLGDGKDRLLQDIDPSQLPEYYGGTLRDPDGDIMCKSKVCVERNKIFFCTLQNPLILEYFRFLDYLYAVLSFTSDLLRRDSTRRILSQK